MGSSGLGVWDLGFGIWGLGLAVYVSGVAWGLIMIDARPASRLGLALLWPFGPLAFVLTIAILFAASLVAYPVVGVGILIAAGVMWWATFALLGM